MEGEWEDDGKTMKDPTWAAVMPSSRPRDDSAAVGHELGSRSPPPIRTWHASLTSLLMMGPLMCLLININIPVSTVQVYRAMPSDGVLKAGSILHPPRCGATSAAPDRDHTLA